MSLEQAMIELVKFAPIAIENDKKNDAYMLPKEFVIARAVLGGRDSGMEIFKSIVQIFKTRT